VEKEKAKSATQKKKPHHKTKAHQKREKKRKKCSDYWYLLSIRDPTALNTPNAYTQLTLEGAFVGDENSTTKWMVPRVKKDVIHPVTNSHVSG